jgi:hypothetical protein
VTAAKQVEEVYIGVRHEPRNSGRALKAAQILHSLTRGKGKLASQGAQQQDSSVAPEIRRIQANLKERSVLSKELATAYVDYCWASLHEVRAGVPPTATANRSDLRKMMVSGVA